MFRIIIFLFFWLPVKGQTVFKTPSGKKYHTAACRTVNNVSSEISLSEAKNLGLEPCKICSPQSVLLQDAPNKAKGENITVQCKGLTKKGVRCKHMTSIANGYCFQHNPDKGN